MAANFTLQGWGGIMEHGGIVKWLVREGDRVEEGQAVVEIETDKVTASIDAPASGVIEGIRKGVVEGASVPVGETIAFIAEKGEEVPALPPLEVSLEGEVERDDYQDRGERYSGNAVQGELNATPVAANLADKRGIDLRAVKGSGPGGKISKEDVISHIETGAVEKGVAGRELVADEYADPVVRVARRVDYLELERAKR